uniref:Fascin n=1 Tax=Sphenodon punctatus TaxID=8508 RepID=A0A8D0GD50_SPHPU
MHIGLINSAGSYLTSECYADGVTVVGNTLGKKQTWELKARVKQGKQTVVEVVGHQGRHLLVDDNGAVRCGQPTLAQHSQFLLEVHPSGAWTLQQVGSRKYLESDGEDVFCVSRDLSSCHMWMPQLAMHIHIVLYNPSSLCYVRADLELDRVWVDTPVPYLEECGFLLRFKNGMYHLETSNHKFVSRSEKLAKKPSEDTAFSLKLKPGCMASLKDKDGRVLYPQGARGLLCLGEHPEDDEEWFILKRCPQFVSLKTKAKRYVSIIYNTEVYAGCHKVTPMSVFQYEFDKDAKTVRLKGVHSSYLAQVSHGPFIVADGRRMEPETRFHVVWRRGKIFLRAFNGRYLAILPVGLVVASVVNPGPCEAFGVRLSNRSFLVLRGQYGYVGCSESQEVLQCNQVEPDRVELLPCKQGIYHFQARGGTFWSLTSQRTFKPWGKFALNFCLEIRGNNLLVVLAPNGYFMRGDRSGPLMADSEEVTEECLWEF